LLLTFYGNLPWFIGLINFSLHIVENYDSRGSNSEHDESQKSEEEPDSAAEGLLGGLGDTEGSKEGGCEGFQESHGSMVRGLDGGLGRFSVVRGPRVAGKNPLRDRNIQYGNGCGLLQPMPGDRLVRRSVRTQS